MLTIFTQDDCPLCLELEEALVECGVPFTTHDVDTVDGRAAYEFARGATDALPMLANIDGRTFAGQAAIDFVRNTMMKD